jgi:predicted enzyme related to lactoylglutathione lyase
MSRLPKPVVHLELHTGNLARACLFYESLLGWRPERVRAAERSYLAGRPSPCRTRHRNFVDG